MQQQSEVLTAFYRAYLDFAEGKQVSYFTKSCGLCHNLFWFLTRAGKPSDYPDVLSEMEQQFMDASLDEAYPFNDGSQDDYHEEKEGNNMTNNQNRLDWVRSHAQ